LAEVQEGLGEDEIVHAEEERGPEFLTGDDGGGVGWHNTVWYSKLPLDRHDCQSQYKISSCGISRQNDLLWLSSQDRLGIKHQPII
jgi:hypothetical protein